MSNIKDIASIRLKFSHAGLKDIGIFTKLSNNNEILLKNTSIIYGHNGAGKSTISREIRNFSTGNESSIKFLDKYSRELDFSEKVKKIFVFNEEFIEDNLLNVSSEGLTPIVLLGEKVKIQKEIEDFKSKLEGVETQIQEINDKKMKLDQKLSEKTTSYDRFIKQRWKARSARYNNGFKERNFIASRTGLKIKSILTPESKLSDLESDFNLITQKIRNSSDSKEIAWNQRKFNFAVDLNKINQYLASTPDKNYRHGNNLEELLSQFTTSELRQKIKNTFSEGSNVCSECFQEISVDYKNSTKKLILEYIRSIENLDFAAIAEDLKIGNIALPELPTEINISLPLKERHQSISDCIKKYIDTVNDTLTKKSEAPFDILEISSAELENLSSQIKDLLDEIALEVSEHNAAVRNLEHLRRKAEILNNEITAIESRPYKLAIDEVEKEINQAIPEWEPLNKQVASFTENISNLESKLNDKESATEHINNLLKVVFGHNGMQLEYEDGHYKVRNRNNTISPRNLSTGEKNILALCYFIVSMSKGKKIFDEDEKLIIFDDPISSLDYDNKYGIVSLINLFANKTFEKNKDSKVAVLTHDLGVVHDLNQIFTKIRSAVDPAIFELKDGRLTKMNLKNDLYLHILSRMYEIATGTNIGKPQELLSHNEIRRFWEAYVTFELGEKITEANVSRYVRNFAQSSPNLQNFLSRFTGHAFINSDSHSELQIRAFNFTLEPVLSENEFCRYIEDILCFIHIISPNHITSRLSNNRYQNVSSNLDSLVNDVLAQTNFL